MLRVAPLSGLEGLNEVTALLQRARNEHPTDGVWEAADFQWWWRVPRSTDDRPKLFWYDDAGPVAAASATDWGSATWLDLIVVPSMRASVIHDVFTQGRELTAEDDTVEMLVDDGDATLIGILEATGFTSEPADVTGWMDAAAAPPISSLPDGFSSFSRQSRSTGDHHFIPRSKPDVETRLQQTSLYRPDLDVFVVDTEGEVAAYGLFWFDPETGVGLVEPMRTEDGYQGKGLARHVITTGLAALADAGAERMKISWGIDNAAAASLYTSVGFEPSTTCSLWTAPSG